MKLILELTLKTQCSTPTQKGSIQPPYI